MSSIDVSKAFEQLQAHFAHCTMINITNNHTVKNRFHLVERKDADCSRLLLRRTNRSSGAPDRGMHVVDFVDLAESASRPRR
jgi:hypothetical protein